jgi:tetratricopeptide (TPR) repeat protein
MKRTTSCIVFWVAVFCLMNLAPADASADVQAWEGTIDIPTYPWDEDVNPKFWALEDGAKLSTTVRGAITYPYVMQDHLSRRKVAQTYKALFLENEYLKITCLPELGGRLHSVFDKTESKEMFHLNRVIKPGMIAMRGAWIGGGVEWNSGPHGHTVTVLSPVNALLGHNADGSAYLEISNQEQIFRTRWTVRVTLHPGRACLDEQICLTNPTDGMHPYYFWNCTAFPNGPGTRFIYPMSLGTDHNAKEFFRWPVHEGRDLSWLKDYETYASVFAVNCTYDFFGAYDVEADRGIVQVADHHELSGKKAWTWGEWEFGKVAQRNLTDEDGPYIEVQSGPLPTQSDYGMLGPRERVAWQESWYPVHGLGDGFEYATRDVAAESTRHDGRLVIRLMATARFARAQCVLQRNGRQLVREQLDLSPDAPAVVTLTEESHEPVDVTVTSKEGRLLAAFTTPLPIPKVEPPDPDSIAEAADEDLGVEQLFLKGRKSDRATDRRQAREYYEMALAGDPGHVASLRSLAVLDFEAGLYPRAIARLQNALGRDADDGLSCFYLGACYLRLEQLQEALRFGYRATRCSGTVSIGYDLVGRAAMRLSDHATAIAAFEKAVRANSEDPSATDHLMLALHAAARVDEACRLAEQRLAEDPTALVPRALIALEGKTSLERFARQTRAFIGADDFELLETSLVFAQLGLTQEASRILQAACVHAVPPAERNFMPLYYLAWYTSLCGDQSAACQWLAQAADTHEERVFASRPEEVEVFQFAVRENPTDAQAHFQLGCLLANLGRVYEATAAWQEAVDRDPGLSIAWRNLGLAAATMDDLTKAETLYRKAITARPGDQTLYRDLAEILIAVDRRPDAIRLLETMPPDGMRRAEITVMLAGAYVAQERHEDCIRLLESTPYFVNWEGQDVTWRLFSQSHIARGRQRLDAGDRQGALADFEAALTYPANLNVGRSNKPEEAAAQYWRGRALVALGRDEQARTAWQAGAEGADVPGTQNEYRQKCREALRESP